MELCVAGIQGVGQVAARPGRKWGGQVLLGGREEAFHAEPWLRGKKALAAGWVFV